MTYSPISVLLFALATGGSAHANDCDSWALTSPIPGPFTVSDLATDGTVVIGVGPNGTVVRSTDGAAWDVVDSGLTDQLTEVVWTGARFVAGGTDGLIFTSVDGLTWTPQTTPTTQQFVGMVWDGAQVVTLGHQGEVAHSADGLSWFLMGPVATGFFDDIAHADGTYVVTGNNKAVYTSPDALSWTLQNTGINTTSHKALAWGAGTWVLVGPEFKTYSTTDFSTWTSHSTGAEGTVWDVEWHTDHFLATGNRGLLLTSPDGQTWSAATAPVRADLMTSVAYGGEVIVAGEASAVFSSSDGLNWTPRTQIAAGQRLARGIWADNTYLAVGENGTVVTSVDGLTWTEPLVDTTQNLSVVAHDGSTWVVAGRFGATLTSPDAVTWTARTNALTKEITGLASSGTLFAAVAYDGIATSPDGVTWTSRYPNNYAAVAYGDGAFVALGKAAAGGASEVVRSTDGLTWTPVANPPWIFASALTYGDGQFVMVGAGGEIFTSPDGTAWSERTSGVGDNLGDVAWDGARYVAVPGDFDYVLTSPDAASWTRVDLPMSPLAGLISWDGGTMVVGGSRGSGSGVVLSSVFPAVCAAAAAPNLAEGGAPLAIDLQLNQAPTDPVTVDLVGDAQVQVSPSQLQFTASDWDQAQSLTLTAVDDSDDEGLHTGTLTATVTSADAAYAGISVGGLVVDIVDNDGAAVIVSESNGATFLTEGGATDTYTLVLAKAPTASVQIDLVPDGQAEATVASVSFDTGNWNVPQTITIQAIDDDIDEPEHSGTVTHTATSADAGYDGLAIDAVVATIVDDDVAAWVVAHTGPSTVVAEGGATDTILVSLGSEPIDVVNVYINSCMGQLSYSGDSSAQLSFTSSDWDIPQSVEVEAVDDSDVEGSTLCLPRIDSFGDDATYGSLPDETFEVHIGDNDLAASLIMVQDPVEPLELHEDDAQYDYVAFQLSLATMPTGDVTLTIEHDDQLDPYFPLTGGPTFVIAVDTFTDAPYLRIYTVDDTLAEGAHTSTLTVRLSSTDAAYDGLTEQVTVDIVDDDSGVIKEISGTLVVGEDGSTDSYVLSLTGQPTAQVTVTLTGDAQVTPIPSSVVFTAGGWDTPQTVLVEAIDDALYEGSHQGTITHVVSSTDLAFDGYPLSDTVVDVLDNDTAPVLDTGDTADTGPVETGIDLDDDKCGCASTAPVGFGLWGLLPLIGLLGARRRSGAGALGA